MSFKMPSLGGGVASRWIMGSAAVVLLALGAIAWMFLGIRKERADTQVALDEAVRDSARFSDLIARTQLLTARRDSIGVRVGIIQKIDQNRYVWAHIMDEVGRALPDYTWLSEMA